MKNYNKTTRENYTLLQDIIDTYRYPDGTLNKLAVFISTLALVLLIILGYFLIGGIKNLRSMEKVSASELTIDEIQEYITNSYMDAIDDYAPGDLDQEMAKRKILKFLADYVTSSNGFTAQQMEALDEIFNEYLSNTQIYDSIEENKKSIDALTEVINNKYEENKSYVDQLVKLLQDELDNNAAVDDTRYKELNSQIENLRAYLSGEIDETNNNLTSMLDELRRTYENSLGAQNYSSGAVYQKGDYVIYNEHLYISKSDNNSSSPQDSSKWELTDLEKIIKNLEKTTEEEINALHDEMINVTNEIKISQEEADTEIINTVNQQGKDFQEQIDAINSKLSSNDKTFQFGYDPETGSYGYMVDGEFKPW